MDKDIISQEEIDLLLSMEEPDDNPGNQADEDVISEDRETVGSDSSMSEQILSQDEIDSMLDGDLVDGEPGETESGVGSSGSDAIMSQNDIDDMLDSLTVPRKTEKKYKLYDFKHPEKLFRDQVRLMKACFEPVPRHLTNYLAKLLRSRIEVDLIEINQRSYGDIFERTTNQTIIGVFNMGSGKPDGIIELSTHLFYCIIERLMGGAGTSITPIRPVTDFERYLATDIFNSILQYYKDILANLVSIEPKIDAIESDGQLIPKTMSDDEILVRNIYEVKIDGISGYLNISIPHSFIGPYFARFSNVVKKMEKKKLDVSSAFVKKSMGYIKIPIYVEFNKKNISAGEAMGLCKGSIIILDHHCNAHLKVNVNGRLKFMGVPGLKRNKLSIKITQIVEDDEELCQAF